MRLNRIGRPRKKSWKDSIKEWTGQSMSSLLGVTEDTKTGDNGRSSQWRHLTGHPNDAWASGHGFDLFLNNNFIVSR